MNVVLKESHEKWTEDGVFECSVRLKTDELYNGWAKRSDGDVEVRIATGIPTTDYNVGIHLNDDGTNIMGRLINGVFVSLP